MQFDEDTRGFSFQKDGPLDMRMDPSEDLTAEDVVNNMSERELGMLFKELGEEKLWRRGARAIVEERKRSCIKSTGHLSKLIEKTLPFRKKTHPATKIFQALRMYVNKELESIEGTMKKAMNRLAPGGKIGVISFHSLEDRIVKNIFRSASSPVRNIQGKKVADGAMEMVTKKPIAPTFQEIRKNRRSRSAKMRFALKR